MNIASLLTVLRVRWMPAVVVFLLVVLAAAVLTARAPKTYLATASIVVDARPDPVSSAFGAQISPALMNTAVDVISSERVALRVVRGLRMADMPRFRELWAKVAPTAQMGQDAWLVATLLRGLEVNVVRAGGNVIAIGYRSTDPVFAADAANAFVRAYSDTVVEMRVDPAREYNAFFEEQVAKARDALEKAQNRLSEFQRQRGILATADRYDLETSQLNLLAEQLSQMQQATATSSSRQGQAARDASALPEVFGSVSVSALKAEVGEAEARLRGLESRLGGNHPQVQEARATLADLRARLAAETRTATASVGVTANIDRAREADLRARLDAQRQKLLKLKEVRDESSVLQREVDNLQRAYDVLLSRYNQTNLESQNRQSSISVLSQAAVPGSPVSPKVAANLLMGLVFGVGLGLAAAFAVEHFDRRLRSPADAVTVLGLPVIGIMPTPSIGRKKSNLLALSRNRVIYGRRLPAPGTPPGTP